MKRQRWYIPVGFWLIFESIAVILWLTKEQVFYLFNFSYIGTVLAVGLLLFKGTIDMPDIWYNYWLVSICSCIWA